MRRLVNKFKKQQNENKSKNDTGKYGGVAGKVWMPIWPQKHPRGQFLFKVHP